MRAPTPDAASDAEAAPAAAPRASPSTPGTRWRDGLRIVAIGTGVGFVLLAAASLAAGDPAGVAWLAAVLVPLPLAVALARLAALRRALPWLVAAFIALLTGATLIEGALRWLGGGAGRVALLVDNPNVLGAALVASAAAWAALAPRRRLVWWVWPIVALAVLYTGSRTSGGALLLAAAVWLVVAVAVPRGRGVVAVLAATAAAATLLALAALVWQRAIVEATPNLLAAPNDLAHGAWNRERAAELIVSPERVPGPFEGTSGQRVQGRAQPDSRLVVYQRVGRSEPGVAYVASIYLRSDEPQQVILSSNLTRVGCEVGPTWTRCVTPTALGNGVSQNQLQLQASERGGTFAVEAWGAQYEHGEAPTPFADERPRWVPQAMVNRFDLRRITLLPENRLGTLQAGLELARDHPLVGVGPTRAPAIFLERSTPSVTYAHNLPVHLLAVHGIVGGIGWLVVLAAVVVGVAAGAGGRGLRRLAPLVAGLAVLNTWDLTLFEPLVLVPVLAAVGALAAGAAGTRPARDGLVGAGEKPPRAGTRTR